MSRTSKLCNSYDYDFGNYAMTFKMGRTSYDEKAMTMKLFGLELMTVKLFGPEHLKVKIFGPEL